MEAEIAKNRLEELKLHEENRRKEAEMAKLLVQASYTADGVRGLMKDGASSRKAAVQKMIEGMGGTVEAFYYAFGETDAVVILDVPDAASDSGSDPDPDMTRFEVQDLKDDTRYEFSLMSRNAIGDSEYNKEEILVVTKGKKTTNHQFGTII